jgi:Fe2+ or Zn2+ uptake regulation protein
VSTTSPATSEQLVDALRARGQRVTSQRLLILDALREADRHVSAEQVLAAVSPRLPGLSLPTVYATLELFEEMGIVRRVSTGRGAVLFDPRRDSHHHLVCRVCGKVEDLDVAPRLDAVTGAAARAGFEPDATELVVRGRCRDCAAAAA